MEDRPMNSTNNNTSSSSNINTHISISDVPLVSFGDLVAPRKDKSNRNSDMSVYTENK